MGKVIKQNSGFIFRALLQSALLVALIAGVHFFISCTSDDDDGPITPPQCATSAQCNSGKDQYSCVTGTCDTPITGSVVRCLALEHNTTAVSPITNEQCSTCEATYKSFISPICGNGVCQPPAETQINCSRDCDNDYYQFPDSVCDESTDCNNNNADFCCPSTCTSSTDVDCKNINCN